MTIAVAEETLSIRSEGKYHQFRSSAVSYCSGMDDAEPLNTTAGEQALWRAVMVQALMDAACLSKKPENVNARREALIWLRGTSEDFTTVCHFAGFDPQCARKMIQESLERGCQWRLTPGLGDRAKSKEGSPLHRKPTARR